MLVAAVLSICGVAEAAEAPGLDALEATRQRPLFAPTRRPPPREAASAPAEAAAAPDAPVPAPNLELRGVIVGHDRRVAIVKHPQDAKTTDLSIGDRIDGWVVMAIQPRTIVLHRDFRSVALDMPEPGH